MAALGFIETKGLLAAIVAADTMVKAADIHLIGKDLAGGGLVTITIGGEVSAVRASVDAAIISVGHIEGASLVSEHVIARPYDDVCQLIAVGKTSPQLEENQLDCQDSAPSQVQGEAVEHQGHQETPVKKTEPQVEIALDAEKAPAATTTAMPETSGQEELKRYTISELKKITVSKLRQIALRLSDISLTREEIKAATKKKLIEAILNVTER